MTDVLGKRVLVVGLARSGLAAALTLRRHGAIVTVTDTRPPSDFQAILPQLLAEKIGVELGSQGAETFLRHELIVVSPGVPWDLPQLRAARERKISIFPEVEAACWFLDGPLVGVTGSNGKTTTATLLGKIFEASGFPTFVGGNIGVPLSTAVDRAAPGTTLVTELSSFQLEGIQDLRPHVAVLLNISPNHLDRHPSYEAYAQAKRQIFRNQQADDYAVLNADDPGVSNLATALASRKVFFSRRQSLPDGVFVSNGRILYRVGHLERVLFERNDVALRGDFNLENVLAAAAAACVLGAGFEALRDVVREFQGVEHRFEFVREICGVKFINNSKATSVDATVKSLEAVERGVHLILGGKDKGAPYTPLRPLLKERVCDVLLIGSAADRIAKELSGATELVFVGDLAKAVREAFERADRGDVVLLAPACSSFDQFQDFEHRGRVFKELVHRLAEAVESGVVSGKRTETVASAMPEVQPAPVPEPVAVTPVVGTPEPPLESVPQTPKAVEGAGDSARAVEAVEPVEVAPSVEPIVEPSERLAEPPVVDSSNIAELEQPAQDLVPPPEEPKAPEPTPEQPQVVAPAATEAEVQAAGVSSTERPEAAANITEVPSAPVEAVEAEAPAKGAEPATEIDLPTEQPGEAPSPQHSKPLDLVYVYEVGAEEMEPAELEPSHPIDEDQEPSIPQRPEAAELVEDEPLPFEARAAAASAAGPSEVKRESLGLTPIGQPRLPGME